MSTSLHIGDPHDRYVRDDAKSPSLREWASQSGRSTSLKHSNKRQCNWSHYLIGCVTAVTRSSSPSEGATGGPQVQVHSLDTLRWEARNHDVLSQFIQEHSAVQDGTGCRNYATFDWDNTAALFDLQENTLLCQLDDLTIFVNDDKFTELLAQGIPYGHECTTDGCSTEATIKAVSQQVSASYRTLYRSYVGFGAGGTLSLPQVVATAAYRDFSAKFVWLYYAIAASYGDTIGYPWILNFGGNQTVAQYSSMVTACVHKHMGIELKWRNFTSADGTITTSVRQGLRTLAELANLFHVLQANGIDPFIVSASLETAVAAFATNPLFGYGLPRSHVLGMRLSQVNGHLGTSYQQGWPVTYRQGKVKAITMAIKSQPQYCNRDPILAGGDSDTDYEMLTSFPGTKLRIVFNRLFTGDLIHNVCVTAVDETPSSRPTVLLQGRDEDVGTLRPSQGSVLLGYPSTDIQVLPTAGYHS